MASAKITLIGLYNYFETVERDLFANLRLPDGMDKQLFINNVLFKGGEFEVMYANGDFISSMIGIWSDKWADTLARWVRALNIDYNPLYNYDRYEEWSENRSGASTEGVSENEHSNNTRASSSSDYSSSNAGSNVLNKISAFNDNTLVNDTSSDTDSNSSTISGTKLQDDGSSARSNMISRNRTDSDTSAHDAHLYGNIGVTTSQQMLQAELEIAEWNLYDHAADLFLREFTIPVF